MYASNGTNGAFVGIACGQGFAGLAYTFNYSHPEIEKGSSDWAEGTDKADKASSEESV
jgi:hypothetical protein